MPTNWLGEKLTNRKQQTEFSIADIRASRRFDPNNYERVVNDVTNRVTSNRSQNLAVSNSLGLETRGLIIGGQRVADNTGRAPTQGQVKSPSGGLVSPPNPNGQKPPTIKSPGGGITLPPNPTKPVKDPRSGRPGGI